MKQVLVLLLLTTGTLLAASNVSQSHYHDYLWATYNQRLGKVGQAEQHYNHMLKQPNSLYTYHGYIKHLFVTKQYNKISALIPQLENRFGNSVDIQVMFAQSLEYSGKSDQAAEKYIALSKKYKTNSEIAYNAATILAQQNLLDEAITVIKDYLDASVPRPADFLFHFLQAQIYYQQKKSQEAITCINTCVAAAPDFHQGWLFYGLMHELSGKINEAITGYQTYLQLVGHDAAVQQQLINLMFRHQQTSRNDVNVQLDTAIALFEKKQYRQALTTINQCLAVQPNYTAARLLKIDTLCALNQTPLALSCIKSWIIETPSEDLWFKTLHLLSLTQADKSAVEKTLQELEMHLKDQTPLPTMYLADLYIRNKQDAQALVYLQKSLPLVKDPQIKTVLYYQMALIHYEQKSYAAMKKSLEAGRVLGERYTPLLNLYAYFEATKGGDLAFAQRLFDSIRQEDKKNTHVAHTQAVITYKQKKYVDSEKLLAQLLQQDPDDFYVNMYYAKSLYKQNKKSKAIAMISSLEKNPHNETEKVLLNKLQKKWARR